MAKRSKKTTQVMLTRSIGSDPAGKITEKKNGFVKNYLIPRGLAILVNGNEKLIEEKKEEWRRNDIKLIEEANSTLEKLKYIKLAIKAESGTSGVLFGSVSQSVVLRELQAQGINIAKQDIVMNPIKLLGDYKIKVRVHGGQAAEIDVSVIPTGSV